MKMQVTKRLLALLLALSILAGFAVPVGAADGECVTLTQVDNSAVSATLPGNPVEEREQAPLYGADDMVRVSIVLERASTLDAGFSTHGISGNGEAMAYRTALREEQTAVAARIERTLGQELDVVWNLTLAANIISANVKYGQLASISRVAGVKKVVLETRYDPKEVTTETAEPTALVSAHMTGANQVWETGYTGGGTRIAVIDTGLDTDHQSFDANAFAYALTENAGLADMSYEDYLAKIDLLDGEEIAEKLSQLHVAERNPELTAEDLYVNLKAPFAYNYIDMDVDITHDNDSQGSHGSHVAGIAAANRYIKRGSNYVSAIEAAGLQGNAPDAQIIVMKVFGKMGGAYDSDYMAAIEDAIILGCDAVNLSLGSSNAGFTTSEVYQTMLDDLSKTDTVVAIAAGNEGNWATYSGGPVPNLYIEDVNLQTVGSPGSYTNALTVASVNNDGTVGPSLKVGDRSFGYFDGDGYYNEPMASLDTSGSGTEYDYVFLDGIGVASDYTGIDVTGKVVFVSRGETNFADKAKVAFQQGAIATVIYNNELEGITMDLSGYWEEPPCVIISMAQGNYVRENSTPATTEDGVTYYTGKVTVQGSASANVENSEYYTMSPFSSWGVPGDLSLKPEITAPGGNIYSVKGDVAETDQYELSSGTSMATPQVAGMVALIQQAIGERGLAQEGMTNRALAQSLLMSTAVPLKDGESRYYSILQQGAGLANVLAATSAKSFVTVDGQADGKVKAELGDDPQRSGVYSFSFRLNNLGEAETVFALSADLFTQDAFVYYANNAALAAGDDSKLAAYLDTATLDLGFSAAWETTGELVSTTEPVANCDFDGDGDVDTDDGQALLDYVTGLRESVSAAEYADVSGDGLVDTYDVHVFLAKLQGSAVAVPAGESVQVTVTLTLSDEAKDYLDTYYTKGAYIQAFVYADAVTDAEGVDGTCHSIPMLAFYGSWTESSMYENGTVQTYATGEELHDPYTGSDAVNTLSVEYARDPGYTYYLGGNPLVADRTYHPERNAFNNTNGDKIYKLQINTIRNAVDSRLTVTNTATGEVLRQEHSGAINAPYYTVVFFMEMWVDGIYSYRLQWAPKNVNEGDTLEFTVDTAPEYYLDEEGNVDWDALGEGATFTVPLTMDSTAPVISGVSVDVINNTLEVEASDNQYVAAVALFNGSGKEVLTYTGSKEDAVPGETYSYEMDLSKANGNKFLVQVYDYAYNVTTYELRMELGSVKGKWWGRKRTWALWP
ncbi:MAG: S8 family serine peptidase [Oscillospiraceae bacterium]|nr:S8 family serine peptidase [Oscillospiraceae bacterium]